MVHLEKTIAVCPKNEDLFVIGGGGVYAQSIHLVSKLDLTRVHHSFEADVYFPEINPAIWELISEEFHPKR